MAKAIELLQWSKVMTAGSRNLEAGQVQEARNAFAEAVTLARRMVHLELLAFSLRMLGLANNRLGLPSEARQNLAEALELYRTANNRRGEAEALAGLAGAAYALEQIELAESLFEESCCLFEQIDEQLRKVMVLCDLGTLHGSVCNWDKALQAYDTALQLCRKLEEKHGQAEILVMLGELSRRQGNLEECAVHLLAASLLFASLGEQKSLASTLQYLGLTYHDMNETERGMDCHRRALSIWLDLGERQEAGLVLFALGKMAQSMGNFATAEEFLLQSLEFVHNDPESAGYRQQNLGGLYLVLHDLGKAEEYFIAALASFRQAGKQARAGEVLETLGFIREIAGDWQEAEKYYLQALDNLPESGGEKRRAELLRTLGLLYADQGQDKKAVRWLWSALDMFRSLDASEASRLEQDIQHLSHRIRRGGN